MLGNPPETPANGDSRHRIQWLGLILGPVAACALLFVLPEQFSDSSGAAVDFTFGGRATLAIMAWMAIWWLTETVDVAVTALLPLVLLPLTGARSMSDAATPYASDLIFLFMGGFLLAISMQRWRLDQRIAVITLRRIGTKPKSLVAGFMIVSAVLSAFVSNTATAAMMLPIALSVIALVAPPRQDTESDTSNPLAICLLLGIAYGATLGGIATIVGTPPNLLLASFIKDQIAPEYQSDLGFARWLMIGIPVSFILLPITWWLLTHVLFRLGRERVAGVEELLDERHASLGRMQRGEWITMIVFFSTAALWITRPWLTSITFGSGDDAITPLAGLTDPGIAMTGALLLFILPVDIARRQFTMTWREAQSLPWGILLLFGGGLSLAAAVRANGVAEFFGAQLAFAHALPPIVIVLIIVTMIVFLTELTSNTATTATLLPILAGLAPAFDMHPYLLIIPATIGASCAFMMPVATPPNAIIFGSGRLTIPQMCKAGFLLNLISILVITGLATILVDVFIN